MTYSGMRGFSRFQATTSQYLPFFPSLSSLRLVGGAGQLLLDPRFDVLIHPGQKRLHHSVAVVGLMLTVHLGGGANVLGGQR